MKQYKFPTNRWYLERAIYLIAGLFVLLGVALGWFISPYFYLFVVFVGLMLINFSLSGYCPMAILLQKLNIPRK